VSSFQVPSYGSFALTLKEQVLSRRTCDIVWKSCFPDESGGKGTMSRNLHGVFFRTLFFSHLQSMAVGSKLRSWEQVEQLVDSREEVPSAVWRTFFAVQVQNRDVVEGVADIELLQKSGEVLGRDAHL